MHDTFFLAPTETREDSLLSWLQQEPGETQMLEADLEHPYGTRMPALDLDDWPLH